MSDQTPNLQLPYLMPDQAQKHVTHNEALQRLDTIVQLVITASQQSPPATPAEGACYAVTAGGTGEWAGRDGKLTVFKDGAWSYLDPRPGWIAWLAGGTTLARFDGTGWVAMNFSMPADARMQTLGLNATADPTNRLAISAAASLFNHEGGNHQLKINRGSDTGSGSVLFQTGFSGRAEFGLTGDVNFSLKVSPNGTAWKTGLTVDPSGVVRQPNNPACRASLNPVALSPASASQTGFQVMTVNQGGFSLGTALTPGPGSRLVVPATGVYLLSLTAIALSSQGHGLAIMQNGTISIASLKGTSGTINNTLTLTTLVLLNANDTLVCQHYGTAQLDFGPGKTELSLMMI